jgi:tetratricopeptide (TPR) repeat protein
MLFLAVRFAIADRALAETKASLAIGDRVVAARAYHSSTIPGASSDLWYSRALAQSGDLHGAIVAGLRATTTAEDPFNAWYSLSALYAAQNDAAGAELCLRNAIRANPNWFKPHWTLARLLAITGRAPEARAQAILAIDLDAGKHAEVTQTLIGLH